MTETSAKRLKTSPLSIGTHNGAFHADEALAVYMLRLLPDYENSQLIRTRNPALLSTCHTVVDVGGEYNAAANRYDHHQNTFNTTFPNRPTKLSSAGLVYMHFGKKIIAQHLKVDENADKVSIIWNKIYEALIEAVDANDNGIAVYDSDSIKAAGLEKKFSDGGFSLASMVSRLNPKWNDPKPSDPAEAQKYEDDKFLIASAKMGEQFSLDLDYYTKSWLPARDIVYAAYAKRMEYDAEGRIMVFNGQSVPWKDHLFSLEAQQGGDSNTLYVLYPEKSTPDSNWRIQCVPDESKGSFGNRKDLPKAWKGLREAELDAITGVPGGVFIHAGVWMGAHRTFEGAKALALKSLAS